MNRILLLLSFTLLTVSPLLAQRPGCDGQRYRQQVFSQVDSTVDILYGSNFSHAGFPIDLYLDVYEPAGDSLTSRPLIVMAHGGSFYFGDRKQLRDACIDYAKRGYVAVSINYRLYYNIGTPLDTLGLFDVVMKAVGDFKAAIRYMRETVDSGNVYGIDPDWVFGGGVSSGAITATIATYVKDTALIPQYIEDIIDSNGGFEGNTLDNYQYSSEVKGMIGYSGAIRDTGWISMNETIPAFCVHEDEDGIVPYGKAEVTSAGLTLELMGSLAITEKLTQAGAFNDLITFEQNAGHVGYFLDSANADFVLDQTASFLNTIYCPSFSDTIIVPDTAGPGGIANLREQADAQLMAFPNPVSDRLTIDFGQEGDHILMIYTMQGSLVAQSRHSTSRAEVNTEELSEGMYFVRSRDGLGRHSNTSVIVRH